MEMERPKKVFSTRYLTVLEMNDLCNSGQKGKIPRQKEVSSHALPVCLDINIEVAGDVL